VAEEDTGAGVFGALNYIDASGGTKKKKTASDAFADPDWSQVGSIHMYTKNDINHHI
jgi:hypothetical protein